MPFSSSLLANRFDQEIADSSDARTIVFNLDHGLDLVGRMIETIHDLVVHASGEVDVDTVCAATLATLALLENVADGVDALDGYVLAVGEAKKGSASRSGVSGAREGVACA